MRRGRRAASNPGEHDSTARVVEESSRVSLSLCSEAGSPLPELKGGVCISTVSNVCGCDTGRPPVANVTGLSRCRLVADTADGTDGIFLSYTYPNDPASGPAFPTEGNVDAQGSQERLRATRAAGHFIPENCNLRLYN